MRADTPPVKDNGAMADEATETEREKKKTSVPRARKKGWDVRAWLKIDPDGRAQLVEVGKHDIMRLVQLPARDLRILDPLLSYPTTILGRKRAIVLNVEQIKAIITAKEVLLLNSKDPAVLPIVLDLQRRLPLHDISLGEQVPGDGGSGWRDNEENGIGKPMNRTPASGMSRSREGSRTNLQKLGQGFPDAQVPPMNAPTPALQSRAMDFMTAGVSPSRATGGPKVLSFEFRALEVCLEAACSCLDAENWQRWYSVCIVLWGSGEELMVRGRLQTTMLEREVYPALDALTSRLSTLNLERIRHLKSRHLAISGRVQKFKDAIEQLLDDNGDMAEMYLTEKLLRARMEGRESPTSSHGHSNPKAPSQSESPKRHMEGDTAEINTVLSSEQLTIHESEDDNDRSQLGASKVIPGETEDLLNPSESFGGVRKLDNHTSFTSSTHQRLDVVELEMLLDACFVQLGATSNRLSELRQYITDSEDYIGIMQDEKQNQLLRMGIWLETTTFAIGVFLTVTGVFGMNISNSLFRTDTTFGWVLGGSGFGCVVIYVATITWCKYKQLI